MHKTATAPDVNNYEAFIAKYSIPPLELKGTRVAWVHVRRRKNLVATTNAPPTHPQELAFSNLMVAAINRAYRFNCFHIHDHPDRDTDDDTQHGLIAFMMDTPIGLVLVKINDIRMGESKVEVSRRAGPKNDQFHVAAFFQRGEHPFLQQTVDSTRQKRGGFFHLPRKFEAALTAWHQTPDGFMRRGPVLM